MSEYLEMFSSYFFSINLIIILLGFLRGALVNVQYIPAQALYLSGYSPKSLIYVILAPMLVWFFISFYLRKLEIEKFVKVFLPIFVLVGVVLGVLVLEPKPDQAYVILWIFVAGFINELTRWGFYEILDRYVNPSRAGVMASYQLLAGEIAVLLSAFLFHFLFFKSQTFVIVTTWCCVALISMLLIAFLNPRVLEVYYMRKKDSKAIEFNIGPWPLVIGFLILGTLLGFFRMSHDTISNSFFKYYYNNPTDLQSVISLTMFIGSFIQICSTFVSAKFVESKRISPFKIMRIFWGLNLIGAFIAIFLNNIYGYIFFMAMPKGLAGFYYPALARLTNSFQYTLSTAFSTLHVIGMIIVAGFIFAVLPNNSTTYTIILVSVPIIAAAYLYVLKAKIERSLSNNLNSKNLEDAVKAAVGLSFLQPKGYVDKMKQVLESEPHRLLKKQVILALGYSHETKATEILLEKFMSDQEEIQITVLEALKIAKNFRSTRFAVDLLLSKKQSLTPRVRLSAAQMIAALYGKKSIPILLQGLNEDDPRLVANTLEALCHFQEDEILQVVKPYVRSDVPRVRANALMYISKFSNQREFFNSEVRSTLDVNDNSKMTDKISIFYIIGKAKNKTFYKDLINTYITNKKEFDLLKLEDDNKISFFQTLLWALYRLGDRSAGEKMYELLIKFSDKFQIRSVLHFFLQLDSSERYDLLDLWLKMSDGPSDMREKLLHIFNESGLNLFEEVEYLKSLKFHRI